MSYVITNGTLYLNNKWKPAKLKDANIFPNKKKADVVFKSCVSKALKNIGFHIEEYNCSNIVIENKDSDIQTEAQMEIQLENKLGLELEVESENMPYNNYIKVNFDELKNNLSKLSEQIKCLQNNKPALLDMESSVDKAISDILHYIEDYNFSACNGYKLCKILKNLRIYRRKIKDQIIITDTLSRHTVNLVAKGTTCNAITGLDKRKYTPRVLIELFENNNINEVLRLSNKLDENI